VPKQPRHRPFRDFPNAERKIIECDFDECIHCGACLVPGQGWHIHKHVQTLQGPIFVAGKNKRCLNPACFYFQKKYYASGVSKYSLPHSTYGIDVLAFIGWEHEQKHRQLKEIHQDLNKAGVLINERNVGKLYRQFIALLGGTHLHKQAQLAQVNAEHGGVIWAIDALQPEGHGTLLYVLSEVLSATVVSAIQLTHASAQDLQTWLAPFQALNYNVLATLSDGDTAMIEALQVCWPDAPRQRCQLHFLANLSEDVLPFDKQLRATLTQDLKGLAKVPEHSTPPEVTPAGTSSNAPLF
jgi:hypothetical protein